jgi:Phage Tail Collar Domain
MAEPFLSEIRIMSFNFAPKGWALANGQLLPINQNQALFSPSLGPLANLTKLECLYAWGSTRVEDSYLSPLLWLPRLKRGSNA